VIVYRLTAPSGKSYIGITTTSLRRRWQSHVRRATALGAPTTSRCHCPNNHPLYAAIRKYGREAFVVVELERAFSLDAAKSREVALIAAMQTYAPLGYNLSAGGEHDSGEGGRTFYRRLRASPQALAAYRAGLSSGKKSADWSNYQAMQEARRAWASANPEQVRANSRNASEKAAVANRERRRLGLHLLSRSGTFLRTFAYVVRQSSAQLRRWASVSPEQRAKHGRTASRQMRSTWRTREGEARLAVRANVAKGTKQWHEAKSAEERAAASSQLAKARKSINHTLRKERQLAALKIYWSPEKRAERAAKKAAL
jgi:hypothetical protein